MSKPYTREFKEKIKDYMVENYANMTLETMGHNNGVSHYTITKLRKELIREGRVPKKKPRFHNTSKVSQVKAKDVDLEAIKEQEVIKRIKSNQEILHKTKLNIGEKVKVEGKILRVIKEFKHYYLCKNCYGLKTCINKPFLNKIN